MKEELIKKIIWYLDIIRVLTIGILVLSTIAFINYFFGDYFVSQEQVEKVVAAPVKTVNQEFADPVFAPSDDKLLSEPNKEQLVYGKELIANTAFYIGFNGKVMKNTNGQNCQNCHLKAGTQPFGNNFLGVEAMYPQIRKRSGKMTDIVGRVNGCLQRSLNGHALDADNPEMAAMVAYISWLGKDSPKGIQPKGTKVYSIKLLDRAADPVNGEVVYKEKCQSCHQADGQGLLAADGRTFTYPPLWGKYSYNDGAGLYRMSKFAGFVRLNMPFGATYERPMLTDEEAWDIAAFVNSQPRPEKDKTNDWPNIADKPFDHPFGPFADPYPESQHKYGPFKPIKDFYKN